MSIDHKEQGFLDRWSKRKQAVEEEQIEAEAEAADAVVEDVAPEPTTDEEALELLRERDPELAEQVSAIEIDKLTYDDDFTVFMNDKVPEFIRRKALSKLWLSSPILANVDGLNDYDDDFRDVGSVIEAVQTALNKNKDPEQEEEQQGAEESATGDERQSSEVVAGSEKSVSEPRPEDQQDELDQAGAGIENIDQTSGDQQV